MRMLIKDTLREIRKSLGRFFSIFAIVAIGVAFFAGVKASAPIMKSTADGYFDDYNLMDIRLLSTLGFTEDDVELIRELPGVKGLFATHTLDVLIKQNTQEFVMKVLTLPDDLDPNNPDYMNQAVLIEGRLPENANECVIEAGKISHFDAEIGTVLTLDSGNDDDLEDMLTTTEFTVVGKVTNPYYLSYQKGSSSIGSGTLSGYIMIPESAFDQEYYTDIYLTVKDVKELNSYEDEYFDVIDPLTDKLEELGKIRSKIRSEDVKSSAYHAYVDGWNAFYTAKNDADQQLAEAQKTLDRSFVDLMQGSADLKQQKQDFDLQIADAKRQIKNGRIDIANAWNTYDQQVIAFEKQKTEALAQIQDALDSVDEAKAKRAELAANKEQLQTALNNPSLSQMEKQMAQAQLKQVEAGIAQIDEILETLQIPVDEVMGQLNEGEVQLAAAKAEIELNEAALNQNEKDLNTQIDDANKQFQEAQQTIDDGWKAYDEGVDEIAKNRRITDEQLLDAMEDLEKAEADILEIEDGEWYVLDRESHYSYMDYGSAADRMGAISEVFPLFFFLVAALICLTTMTRMVDEQRGTIGTLKALGYSKAKIAVKYLSYAFLSSVGGSIVGVIIGFAVFPRVIYTAWNIMYELPPVQLEFIPSFALQASVAATLITLGATIAAVYKELIETPALLMRPKAPKNGKRVFLERIPLIWKHLSFSKKVTVRNLIRYKKRFFMTVIGISGCTALLVAGFGIQDSIGDIVPKQFEEIQNYQVNIEFDKDLNVVEKEEIMNEVQKFNHVVDIMEIAEYNGKIDVAGKEQSVTIVVPTDVNKFKDFVNLRTRRSHTPVEIKDDGAVISEKLANDLNVGIGDLIQCENDDIIKQIKIVGIVENYVGHYLYMSETGYKSTYGFTSKATNLFVKTDSTDDKAEENLGNHITKIKGVSSVVFYSGTADSFSDTIKSLGFVVVVLVISAALLAFVVLYNLTNVNISERIREIATIKVLGFYDNEVSAYVFRENLILSFIGALCGLILGTLLHRLIMSMAELDSVMFGRTILLQSYVLSVVITMFFSWLVAKVMHHKLKGIPMVESLKSVE